uniref:RING-type E3 ubiquitin transferase n=1 Tax=Ditylenchus dipsaci TaxID=166011 RepID=A0A915CR39_9BILA
MEPPDINGPTPAPLCDEASCSQATMDPVSPPEKKVAEAAALAHPAVVAAPAKPADVPGTSLRSRLMNNILNSARSFGHHYQSEEHDEHDQDICRVCRLTGEDSTLYHPCLCTGSIKYVHQDCLMQWLKYSKKEVCELCNHKFSFKPVYREDMPERLPLYDLVKGVFVIAVRFLRLLLTYSIVCICWLGLVPLMASRIYRIVFSGLVSSVFSLRILNLFSTENIAVDIVRGSVIVAIFLCTFISLVWLREQIMNGAPPYFLHLPVVANAQEENAAAPADENNNNNGEAAAQEAEVVAEVAVEGEQNQEEQPADVQNGNQERMAQALEALAQAQNQLAQELNNLQQPPPAAAVANNPAEAVVVQNVEDAQRIVDDFTWQRLLGFDGTLAFVEHVVWTILLNVVFNVVFLYWPAQTGAFLFSLLGYSGKISYFEMPICILAGYLVVVFHSLVLHTFAKWFGIKTLYTMSAMVYLMLKVFLLIIVEVVLFPIICGCWLDICSLPLTGATLEGRIKSFQSYPSSSIFLHWLIGMVYVFYSASFILVLRELLRPGVLWFIRNLNDPEFNPILEMIQQPLTRHLRRLIASTTLFFSIILLVVYFPLKLIRSTFPSILPYVFTATADTPLGEFSLELILLQIVMPTILEYSKAFSILKRLVRLWCRVVGGWLGLDSYLLPAKARNAGGGAAAGNNQPRNAIRRLANNEANADQAPEDEGPLAVAAPQPEDIEVDGLEVEEVEVVEQEEEELLVALPAAEPAVEPVAAAPANNNNNHLAARHQALLMMREPTNYEAYKKPEWFGARIAGLLVCLAVTAVIISYLFFVLPVSLGRALLSYLAVGGGHPVHDLYTVSAGLYFCWLVAKVWMITHEWFQKGWDYVKKVFHSTAWLALRLLLVAGSGTTESEHQPDSIVFPWKEWAMGVVHFKIFCASVLMGPDWWLKTVFEQVYADGVRGFRLQQLYIQLIVP